MRFKQLEWTQDEQGDWSAYGFFGAFYVENTGDEFEGSLADSNDYDDYEPGFFPTAEQAKVYCQSLFDKQVAGTGKDYPLPSLQADTRCHLVLPDKRGGLHSA